MHAQRLAFTRLAVAAHLKATTDVPNPWLAEKLEMGSGFYVSKHVGHLRKNPEHPAHRILQQIKTAAKVKGTA
jgi:putative transposase